MPLDWSSFMADGDLNFPNQYDGLTMDYFSQMPPPQSSSTQCSPCSPLGCPSLSSPHSASAFTPCPTPYDQVPGGQDHGDVVQRPVASVGSSSYPHYVHAHSDQSSPAFPYERDHYFSSPIGHTPASAEVIRQRHIGSSALFDHGLGPTTASGFVDPYLLGSEPSMPMKRPLNRRLELEQNDSNRTVATTPPVGDNNQPQFVARRTFCVTTKSLHQEPGSKRRKRSLETESWKSPVNLKREQSGPSPDPGTHGGESATPLFASDWGSSSPTDGRDPDWNPPRRKSQEITADTHPRRPRITRTSKSETSRLSDTASPTVHAGGKGSISHRLPHNQVERRYREGLNAQIDSLRKIVPKLQKTGTSDAGDLDDLDPTRRSKPSKSTVLASAAEYLEQLEVQNKQLTDENALLWSGVKALQTLIKCEDCSLMHYMLDMKLDLKK
ncbi:hypothetical protein B0A49_02219 [Cryomyces minteri]|uniref:BHLH domain-containing protein n=1 Tax=Cryomyces minteri TaxID=331657 RepID=A0A4U0XN78_9PEZI|nr:hypothetical protein B0A49_02219 [Cryomyces minteri]